ncbi:MAG: hypothetical protein V5A57_01810 [Candidatus Paceibacterota bacterium]
MSKNNKKDEKLPLHQNVFRRLKQISNKWGNGSVLENTTVFFELLQLLLNSKLSKEQLMRSVKICSRAKKILKSTGDQIHRNRIEGVRRDFLERLNS